VLNPAPASPGQHRGNLPQRGIAADALIPRAVECCDGRYPALRDHAVDKNRMPFITDSLDKPHGVGQHEIEVGVGV
jgi:hypothetical protein